MKTLLLFGLFLICLLGSVRAQDSESTKQITIGNNTYSVTTIIEDGHSTWIEKNTDRLRHLERQYDWVESMNISYDNVKMGKLVKKYIVPIVKQSGLKFDEEDFFSTSIIFDMNGDSREFAVFFTGGLEIPMAVINDFFNAVLSSGIKCTYKKDHPGLKNAQCIYGNDVFKLDIIQNSEYLPD